MKNQPNIEAAKLYSAREAIKFFPGMFKTETMFRDFLRNDMLTDNIFNAKMYTTSKLPRFVIRGDDLIKAVKLLKGGVQITAS